eukprot:CAMPEP_0197464850 /NCGR_PEP_ID=MMETSP1175-20131217/64235_1 /TAXON_ID=1003142 /ORGANISM="Triceratium dubium, Strain CCMP147" /LENGTH=445 /DNA_ID=CAMNT_0043000851 /DNA_START=221 /DNA_END=1558 /DNA_ORIENTATION=+
MKLTAKFLFAASCGASALHAVAFTPLSRNSLGSHERGWAKTTLKIAPVGPEFSDQAVSHVADLIASSATILADAADATAEVAADNGGWWQDYLSVFKAGLTAVHSTIDGPLRSMGWEQTWGVSIFLFTAGVRSLLVPISLQQSKSSEYMKALKPYQDEIKAKFADRKEVQNRAIAKLYEDAGQNPLSGCLISLAQIPIFLGLYRSVTLLAKDGQLQEPFLWIPSLEGPVTAPTYRGLEWLTEGWTSTAGGFPTPSLGWETTLAFLAMPLILVLGQSLTMNILQPPMDENMSEEEKDQFEKSQLLLKFLPLMIGFFSLQVPAGLTIYWFTSNAFTLSQSLAVKAYYKANPPKIELPEYWDALDDVDSMTPEERRAAAAAGINAGPKFEDLLDEAKFHYVVQRHPLRESSPAWERAQANGSQIPEELAGWVNGASVSSEKSEEPVKA